MGPISEYLAEAVPRKMEACWALIIEGIRTVSSLQILKRALKMEIEFTKITPAPSYHDTEHVLTECGKCGAVIRKGSQQLHADWHGEIMLAALL